jgi:hypothetical protein
MRPVFPYSIMWSHVYDSAPTTSASFSRALPRPTWPSSLATILVHPNPSRINTGTKLESTLTENPGPPLGSILATRFSPSFVGLLTCPERSRAGHSPSYLPLARPTSCTVLIKIFRSSFRLQFSTYSRSNAMLVSNEGSRRAVTCHRPVIPGFTSNRRRCSML